VGFMGIEGMGGRVGERLGVITVAAMSLVTCGVCVIKFCLIGVSGAGLLRRVARVGHVALDSTGVTRGVGKGLLIICH
jgi:hypothetical protein